MKDLSLRTTLPDQMTALHDTARARRIVLQRLECLHRAGVKQIPKLGGEPAARTEPNPPAAPPAASAPPEPQQSKMEPANAMATSSNTDPEQLKVLQAEVAQCTACKPLADSRTQTVFGVGNPRARLCFLGEAPGVDEDRQGEPFVGRAGKLLTDIIEKGMGLQRSDVYILNILKCRPPGNRNPSSDEVDNCRHFFERQLELIQPEFICCLGAVAAQRLLETSQAIGRLRGRWHDYRGIRVMATYHPAYLLRNPSAKKTTWEDIQMLMREMGLPIHDRA